MASSLRSGTEIKLAGKRKSSSDIAALVVHLPATAAVEMEELAGDEVFIEITQFSYELITISPRSVQESE